MRAFQVKIAEDLFFCSLQSGKSMIPPPCSHGDRFMGGSVCVVVFNFPSFPPFLLSFPPSFFLSSSSSSFLLIFLFLTPPYFFLLFLPYSLLYSSYENIILFLPGGSSLWTFSSCPELFGNWTSCRRIRGGKAKRLNICYLRKKPAVR